MQQTLLKVLVDTANCLNRQRAGERPGFGAERHLEVEFSGTVWYKGEKLLICRKGIAPAQRRRLAKLLRKSAHDILLEESCNNSWRVVVSHASCWSQATRWDTKAFRQIFCAFKAKWEKHHQAAHTSPPPTEPSAQVSAQWHLLAFSRNDTIADTLYDVCLFRIAIGEMKAFGNDSPHWQASNPHASGLQARQIP